MLFQLAHLERETHDLVVLGHRAFGDLGAEIAGKLNRTSRFFSCIISNTVLFFVFLHRQLIGILLL